MPPPNKNPGYAGVLGACDEKRGTVSRKEGDGNEGSEEKEERKT